MPEILIESINNKLVTALKVYYAADEGSNPRQHFRSVINISYKTAGLVVYDLYAAMALLTIQTLKNIFLAGAKVNRHLNVIQIIVWASRNTPEMLIEFLLES